MLIVIIGLAVIGYALMKPQSSDKSVIVSDIEATLDQFAYELEQDNQELIAKVTQLKREFEAEINKLNGRLETLENLNISTLSTHAPRIDSLPTPALSVEEAPASQEVEQPLPKTDENAIKHRYEQLFGLYEKGKSIEQIAKKLGMNKGEVQLIIQLAKQEEQFRVEG